MLDDAYHFLQDRGLAGNCWTVRSPPSLQSLQASHKASQLPLWIPEATPFSSSPIQQRLGKSEPRLLVWSSAGEGDLKRLLQSYGMHMDRVASSLNTEERAIYLDSLAYTLASRRSSLSWKSFSLARPVADLHGFGPKISKPVRSGNCRLGYIFTGQGAQYARMSVELLRYPTFSNSLRQSEAFFQDLGCEWSLLGRF